MVAGLEQPTAGTITLGGQDVTGTRAHQRPVNTVFQSYALFPHLTVGENVAFGLKRSRAKDVAARVADGLDLVELGHLADRKPAQLSGGQQQRVALARALVNRPALLLLDEPLGALDLKLRRQMQLELKRIQTEVGLTFVHVTHDQEEAMTMADTVAVMNHGRIEQLGSPADLYELPRTAFVANFLGQSNLVAGTVTERLTKRGLLGVDVARDAGPGPGGARGALGRRGARRGAAGEDAAARRGPGAGPRRERARSRDRHRRLVHGREHAVPGGDPGPRHVRRLRAEPARRCHGHGRDVRAAGLGGRLHVRAGRRAGPRRRHGRPGRRAV